MPRWKYIWIYAMKDLKRFFIDKGALAFFIIFPVFFMTIFSFMGGGASDPRFEFILVTREAPGGLSHQILAAMETKDVEALEPGSPIITAHPNYAELLQKVENDELSGFIAFPENFTEGLYSGSGATLEIIVNPENVTAQAALNGLASSLSSQLGSHYVIANSTIELMITSGLLAPADTEGMQNVIAGLFTAEENLESLAAGITIDVRKVGEIEADNPINWSLTGYLVMFVFFGAALSAASIVKERQNHTLERILAGSIKRSEILGGIFLGTVIKGIIQIILFWGFGILVFGADLGLAPAAVVLLSFIVVIMSAAFSSMLATVVKTERSADSAGTLSSLILAPLGGCWWPLFILPKWMQGLGKATPHGWANTGFNKLMLFGAEFNDVIPEMLVLIGFAVVFGAIAIWKFRATAD